MSAARLYPVAPTRIGNSRGYRVDASFFQEHPEMGAGEFEAAYIGADVVLLRRRTGAESPGASHEAGSTDAPVDPVVAAYLGWTERAMREQPYLLRELSADEFGRAKALVEGVAVDVDRDRLPDDFELPDPDEA